MRLIRSARFALALSLACAGLAACAHSAADANAPLIPAVAPPIADVPIPAGFAMTGASTSKVESTGLRFVDHQYSGSDDPLPVVRFYKDQMPTQGWNFVSQNQLPHSEIILRFSKNSEDCAVTITPGTFHTHIRVQIDPSGRDAAR